MNRIGYIFALCLFVCGLTAGGQTYERVYRSNLWNESKNINGVRQDTVSRSYAEAYASYEGGEFCDTWQAAEGWSAGAVTASIRHMERMSLAGSFSFDQTEGYDMCGSMFIKPGLYPIDVLEFTPGRKTLQTYAFDGGISYDLSPAWSIGAKMDFESANMAKRKDLRHTNWRLDMEVAPGFMYRSGDFVFGANYILRKTAETVEAEQVGTSESSYYAFLDKGMMYGVHSVWNGSGVHLEEAGVKGLPVKEISNGAAVQMQYEGLFAEVSYAHTQGTVGEKEYIWFRFPGNEAGAVLGYKYAGSKAEHYGRLRFGWKGLGLDESILEKVSENGVTTVYNHGSKRILNRGTWALSPEYEYVSKMMEIIAGVDIEWTESLSSQIYPYLYRQSLMTWRAGTDIILHLGQFDLGASAAAGGGSVHEEESMVSGTSGVQTAPFRLQEWYDRHMEYKTALRTDAGLSARYNFRKGIYLKAECSWKHGFGLRYIGGSDRFGAGLAAGLSF